MDIEIAQVAIIKKTLSNDERLQFDMQFGGQRKNPTTALIIGLFFGLAGIDRFYIGHTGLGIGKLITVGGIGFWTVIDWFLIKGAARRSNIQLAQEIHTSLVQMRA